MKDLNPRLLLQPADGRAFESGLIVVWFIIGSFFATAFMARSGNEYFAGHADLAHDILDGSGSFVSFTIVFYVGYCYTRYTNQFDDVQLIMNSIVNACLSARATFSDQQEVHRLWRYLNLLHVSAYCGMTDYLTKDNFFMPLCEKHKLLGEDGFIREEELAALDHVGLDESGARACSMYQVWCYEVLKEEQKRSGSENFSAPIHAQLSNEVKATGDHIKRLFAYRCMLPKIELGPLAFPETVANVPTSIHRSSSPSAPLYLHASRVGIVGALPVLHRLHEGALLSPRCIFDVWYRAAFLERDHGNAHHVRRS